MGGIYSQPTCFIIPHVMLCLSLSCFFSEIEAKPKASPNERPTASATEIDHTKNNSIQIMAKQRLQWLCKLPRFEHAYCSN